MPWLGNVSAYLVVPFAIVANGLWARQAETICLDRDLAIDIAQTESEYASGVGVYPLDAEGRCLTVAPIAWYGLSEPPTDASANLALISTIRVETAAVGGGPGLRLH
ncbi:hypothetical protein V5F38_15725 [Xanthobacter sp. V0B-10]|uniref:hypothetical protein n=1 Tax=Xanthobacter albus TaxID=3119929 RepID=UPI00372A23DB